MAKPGPGGRAPATKKKAAKDYGGSAPAPIIDASHTPIGVAPDYTVNVPNPSRTPGFTGPPSPGDTLTIKPRYFPGAQNTEIVGLSPEDIGQLQVDLKALGLIPKKTPILYKVWDDASKNAFKEVLAWANARGVDWRAALDELKQNAASGGTVAEAPTQTKEATNPLDVQALGRSTGQAYIGRGLTDSEQGSLTADFQAKEAPYLMSDSTTGAPSSEGWQEWAKTKVREFDPVNFDSHKLLAGVDVLSKMLGSGQ